MNIDLLFFESSFEKKDDYIKDQEIFQEYINTHSFEGNSNGPELFQEELKENV